MKTKSHAVRLTVTALVVATMMAVSACSGSDSAGSADSSGVSVSVDGESTTPSAPAESKSTTPTTSATQPTSSAPPSTTAVTTSTQLSNVDLPVIDLGTSSLGGFVFGSPATELEDDFISALGAPSSDTEWQRVSPLRACLNATEIRSLSWGDVRVQLERTATDGTVFLGGWVVGEGSILGGPAFEAPSASPLGVATTEGVGIGSDADAITNVSLLDNGDTLVVLNPSTVIIRLDADRRIVGFVSGRNDCLEPSITSLACDRPIPVRTLPDGTATTDDSASFVDGRVVWGDSPLGSIVENTVTQVFDFDKQFAQLGANSAITVQRGSLDIRVMQMTSELGPAAVYVFEEGSECIRLLHIGPGLDAQQLQDYAEVLAEGFEPLR